ncbi:hypothetical protein AgCh_010032 [Apium graveolens]
MSSKKFDDLSDINNRRDPKIRVKVVRFWRGYTKQGQQFNNLECLLTKRNPTTATPPQRRRIQARRRRSSPATRSYHLALEGGVSILGSRCPWIHLHQQALERVHLFNLDVRSLIELNQYKYTNVSVAEEHMANLTSDELAEAIRLYRQEQTRLQEEAELEEESEESGDSQQSKRSVFDRIGAKGKKNKKDQGNKKEAEAAKQRKLEKVQEQIRKEEEAKLELKI